MVAAATILVREENPPGGNPGSLSGEHRHEGRTMSSKKKVRVPGQPKLPKDREWIQWGLDHIPRPLSLTEIQNKAAAERLVPARTRITGTVKLVRKT
ncbi:MAG TPA: hypothetical protein VI893_06240, partial [Thermoplasmata archaeon]|nr:hypothetical protein [Thermoplasmata archaeon]